MKRLLINFWLNICLIFLLFNKNFVYSQTCGTGTCYQGTVCSSAPAGKYSTGGVRAPCVDCPAGKYSVGGASSCPNVNAGYYSLLGTGTSATGNGICAPGRYGTGGSATDQCTGPCIAGRYGTGGSTSSTCTGYVLAGYWSDPAVNSGNGATNSTGHGPCDAGRYGTTGATSRLCNGPCNQGRYSSAGFYGTSGSSCTACLAGKYNPNYGSGSINDCLPCPAGYYCVAAQISGTLYKCNAGRYGSLGMSASTCTGACPAGYYCPAGSIHPTEPGWGTNGLGAFLCGDRKFYCAGGNSAPVLVPGGNFGTPTSAPTMQTGFTTCPIIGGYYCSNGIQIICPPGKYSLPNQGSSYYSYCRDCAGGYICPGEGNTRDAIYPCSLNSEVNPAQYYCPSGSFERKTASAGYYTTPHWYSQNLRVGMAACDVRGICIGDGFYRSIIQITGNACVTPQYAGGGTDVREYNISEARNRQLNVAPYTRSITFSNTFAALNGFSFSSWTKTTSFKSMRWWYSGRENDPKCQPTSISKNQDIFSYDPVTTTISLTRTTQPDWLNFEVCPPYTNYGQVRYRYTVSINVNGIYPNYTGSPFPNQPVSYSLDCNTNIYINDANDPPVFGSLFYQRQMPEKVDSNYPAGYCDESGVLSGCTKIESGFNIGLDATDEDAGAELAFSILPEADNVYPFNETFKIHSCTGVITTIYPGSIKYREAPTYIRDVNGSVIQLPQYSRNPGSFKAFHLRVSVSDKGNLLAVEGPAPKATLKPADVWIYIVNVNDPPVIPDTTELNFTVNELDPAGTELSPKIFISEEIQLGSDEDYDTITYSLYRNDDGCFKIVNNILSTTSTGASVINYESTKTIYSIDIQAIDGNGGTAIKTYNVYVQNKNDAPIVVNSLPLYVIEGTPDIYVCASSSGDCDESLGGPGAVIGFDSIITIDPDNDPNDNATFIMTENAGGRFVIEETTGRIKVAPGVILNFESTTRYSYSAFGNVPGFVVGVKAISSGIPDDMNPRTSQTYYITILIVNVNEEPTFPTGENRYVVMYENTPKGFAIDDTFTVIDPDNEDYLLRGVSQQVMAFSVEQDSNSGATFFEAFTPDFSKPSEGGLRVRYTDQSNIDYESSPDCPITDGPSPKCFMITIKAIDNGFPPKFGFGLYYIFVLDVNEAPSFVSNTLSFSIIETFNFSSNPLTLGANIHAVDEDTEDSIKYYVIGGTGVNIFDIETSTNGGDNNKGSFSVVTKVTNFKADYETGQTTFTLIVEARDKGPVEKIGQPCSPSATLPDECNINSFAICKPSILRCIEKCQLTVNNINGTDVPYQSNGFYCNYTSTGQPASPTYDKDIITITINIADANDPPRIISPASNGLSCLIKSTIAGTLLPDKDQTPVKELLSLTYDPDTGGRTALEGEVEYTAIAAPLGGKHPLWGQYFTLNNNTGQVKILKNAFVVGETFDVDDEFIGIVRVSDKTESTDCTIVITLTSGQRNPKFVSDLSVTVSESLAPGDFVVDFGDLSLIDPDVSESGDILTFEMSPNPSFNLNSTTGEITVGTAGLDYEDDKIRTTILVVSVRDSTGARDVATVSIFITDANDPPSLSKVPNIIEFNENLVASSPIDVKMSDSSRATDPDATGSDLSWRTLKFTTTCSGFGDCPFKFDSETNGQLIVTNELDANVLKGLMDFESPPGQWTFNITATDGGFLSATKSITLKLKNVNDPPELIPNSQTETGISEIAVIGQRFFDMKTLARDPDAGDDASLVFKIVDGDPTGYFTITSSQLTVNKALDFEDRNEYGLTIEVRDAKNLFTNFPFTVNILNAPDITITSVSPAVLPCNGTTTVTITGTNFGFSSSSSLRASAGTPVVAVTYQSTLAGSKIYTATNCAISGISNTQITCQAASPGIGTNLRWSVNVTVGTYIVGDVGVSASGLNRYTQPQVTEVVANSIKTSGNDIIIVRGTCLGDPSESATFSSTDTSSPFYVRYCPESATSCIFAKSCTISNSNEITCVSSPGVGKNFAWQVMIANQINTDSFRGGKYHPPLITSVSHSVIDTSGTMPKHYCPPERICPSELTACGDTCIFGSCDRSQGLMCETSEDTSRFIIKGTNFGLIGTSPDFVKFTYYYYDRYSSTNSSISFSWSGCIVTKEYTEVSCVSVQAGMGSHLVLSLSFGLQSGSASDRDVLTELRYISPSSTRISGDGSAGASTSGGQTIEIRGANFGPRCPASASSIEGENAQASFIPCPTIYAKYNRGTRKLDNSLIVYEPNCRVEGQGLIICLTRPGTGANHTWHMEIGDQIVANVGNFKTSYTNPTVGGYDGIGSKDALTPGMQEIFILGGNFGPKDGAPIYVQYGPEEKGTNRLFEAVSCEVDEDHIKIKCLTDAGAGAALVWVALIDGQESTSETTNYAKPSISALSGPGVLAGTDSFDTVIIDGLNFGPPEPPGPFLESVTYGPVENPYAYDADCTLISHSQISCLTEPGIGKDLVWRVQIKGQGSGNSIVKSSYRPPHLLELSKTRGNTRGGERIDIKGLDFALCDQASLARVDFGGLQLLEISTLRMGKSGAQSLVCLPNLPVPYIPSEDYSIRVVRFVTPEMTDSRYIDIGVTIQSSRLGDGHIIESNNTIRFTFDAPRLDFVFAEPQLDVNILTVTVLGLNFCASERCCRTYLNDEEVPLEKIYTHTHSSITFESKAVGNVYVRCSDTQSNNITFESQDPHIVATTPQLDITQFDTVGGVDIDVYGIYFGQDTPKITVGGRLATVKNHIPGFPCEELPVGANFIQGDSQVYCYKTTFTLPPGEGAKEPLVIANGEKKSHADDPKFELVRFKIPVFSSMSFPLSGRQLQNSCPFGICFDTQGGQSFVITGSNFGTKGNVWFGYVGNTKATITSWSHTEIRGQIPGGEGKDLMVIVDAGGQYSLATDKLISYGLPIVASIELPKTYDGSPLTSGGEILIIRGKNFGRPYRPDCAEIENATLVSCTSYAPSVSFISPVLLPLSCAVTENSHEEMKCIIPQGAGVNLLIQITVRFQTFLSSVKFSYGRPRIDSISPDIVPTSGLSDNGTPMVMKITGINFGTTDLCVKILDSNGVSSNDFAVAMRAVTGTSVFGCRKLDGTDPPLLLSSYTNDHNQIHLNVPEFYGKNVLLVVEAATQQSLPLNYSYLPPEIFNITMTDHISSQITTFDASLGREIGRCAFCGDSESDSSFGYGAWSTRGSDLSECLRAQKLKSLGWNLTYLDISSTGEYDKEVIYHLRDPGCLIAGGSFKVVIKGKYTDNGPHTNIKCAQSYEESTNSITVTPLSAAAIEHLMIACLCGFIWELGVPRIVTDCVISNVCKSPGIIHSHRKGFGAYLIAENNALYMGDELFPTITEMYSRLQLNLPNKPTALVVEASSLNTPTGPTDGCFAWEDERSFEMKRIEAERKGREISKLCIKPALLTLVGKNFGVTKPGVPSGLRVFFTNNRGEFEAATVASKGTHENICEESVGCLHSHNKLVIQIPPGFGRNTRIRLEIGSGLAAQTSIGAKPLFHYQAPFILEANPGTVQRRYGFLDANGQKLIVRGYNFGGEKTDADVLLNGKICENAEWKSGLTDPEGQPYLICDSQRDVVGPKSLFVCVADQATVTTLYPNDAEVINTGEKLGVWSGGIGNSQGFELQLQSMINTRCQVNENGTRYFANFYGLCQPCKSGANCNKDSTGAATASGVGFSIPKSDATWYRYAVPVYYPNGTVTGEAKKRCSPESWNETLYQDFPQVVISEYCYDFVRCVPEESCIGDNHCAEGYQYAFIRCQDKRKEMDNKCDVALDPYTGTWVGNNTQCNPTGKVCRSGNPEYCSICNVELIGDASSNIEDVVAVGTCTCQEPERCALCSLYSHFRLNNECQKCPDNPGLLIGMFFAVAFIAIGVGYYLQRRNFNLAFISIGVDYCQVIAMFSSTKIKWPAIIKDFLKWLSLINFNIDITAPECLVPNLEYPVKWYLQEMIPFGIAGLMLMYHGAYSGYKYYHYGKEAKFDSHTGQLLAIYTTMFYYLYLNITKKALDIFNCNPVDPPDGFLYTEFSSISCDGGLCRCYEENGVQTALIPIAVFCLIVYTFGFPVYIAWRLYSNRRLILEDQYLRASSVGDTRKTNPNAYDVRKKFHKIYFHFVPEKTYWILVIIFRKFLIAFASLMFRGNASFQMSFILMVLFWSYVLQVMNRPYMSTGEVDLVNEHLDLMCRRSVEDKSLDYYNEVKGVVLAAKRVDVAEKRKMQTVRYDISDAAASTAKKKNEIEQRKEQQMAAKTRAERARLYFVNYNTVESTLLSCAILLCLCGIMFESRRLDRDDLVGQRDALAYFVIFVVIGSFVYYFTVFIAEMTKTTKTNICIRIFLRRTRPDDLQYDPDRDTTIKLGVNPFHSSSVDDTHKSRAQTLEQALSKAEDEKLKLQEELARARSASSSSRTKGNDLIARPSIDMIDSNTMDDQGINRTGSLGSNQAVTGVNRLAGSLYSRPSAAAKHKAKGVSKAQAELESTTVDMKALMGGGGATHPSNDT